MAPQVAPSVVVGAAAPTAAALAARLSACRAAVQQLWFFAAPQALLCYSYSGRRLIRRVSVPPQRSRMAQLIAYSD
jgi:hypothetical protein